MLRSNDGYSDSEAPPQAGETEKRAESHEVREDRQTTFADAQERLSELAAIAAEPYEPRGIPHSEMAMIIGHCRMNNIDTLIESGRARGQSTYILAKYLPGVAIHSIEVQRGPDEDFAVARLRNMLNVSLHVGQSEALIPKILGWAKGKRVAILLDGPKRAAACELLQKCFSCPWVVVGFIHDLPRQSPYRKYAEEMFPTMPVFSDDSCSLRWMDNGHDIMPVEGSDYGPTLGVFYP